MAIITLDKKEKIHVPSTWNQLALPDLLFMVRNLVFNENKLQFYLFMFFHYTGMKLITGKRRQKTDDILVKYKNQVREITPLQAVVAGRAFKDLLTKCDLNRQRLPRVRVGLRTFYGPRDRLFNLIWEEYEAAERQWERFNKTQEEQYLHRLAAILYRPADSLKRLRLRKRNGDIRKAYDENEINRRARHMAKIDHGKLMLIYYFFEGSRLAITYTFSECFSKNVSQVRNKSLTLVDALAQGNLIDYDKVRRAYLYDAMNNMNSAAINYKEMKKSMKK